MFRIIGKTLMRASLLLTVVLAVALPAGAQLDMSGEWAVRMNEDQLERVAGPDLGDYLGLPLNEAGRRKAETWNADILSQQEQQAKPHPAQYSMRGPGPNLRWEKVVDPLTARLVAYTIAGTFGRADRTIWMDGRPHPSEYAEHTWQGFSTGEYVGNNALKVTTTHMKTAIIRRNGAPVSYKSEMTEYFYLQDRDRMLGITIINDPIYFEEPFVRTTNWQRAAAQHVGAAGVFEIVNEVDQPLGWVPHWPIGTQHRDFAGQFGVPFEATKGGKATMYPEYQKVLEPLLKELEAEKQATPAAPAR